LDIEKTRFADRLKVKLDVEEETRRALVPSMLLQPLAENAVKYAIALSESGGTIRIRARREEQKLSLQICDSGNPEGQSGPESEAPVSTGVGLSNVRDRLSTLYDNDYSLTQTRTESGGMEIHIRIPFESRATKEDNNTTREVTA
jgi:LytS/YehU family sensor histidine kinase